MTDEPKLTISVEHRGSAAILCPSGRVDGNNADILEGAIDKEIEAGHKVLIFDFHELSYISSAGLRILLTTSRRLEGEGGQTMFCELAEHIAHVFEISGFSDILDMQDSLDEALSTL